MVRAERTSPLHCAIQMPSNTPRNPQTINMRSWTQNLAVIPSANQLRKSKPQVQRCIQRGVNTAAAVIKAKENQSIPPALKYIRKCLAYENFEGQNALERVSLRQKSKAKSNGWLSTTYSAATENSKTPANSIFERGNARRVTQKYWKSRTSIRIGQPLACQ